MRLVFALLLANAALYAAVEGTVVNKTTGQPQAGVAMNLLAIGTGMQPAGNAVTDAQGHFSIDFTPKGPCLLQSNFQNVSYNRMIPPGTPSTGLNVEVYNASRKPGDAKVAQHMVLLQPSTDALQVDESIIYNNSGTTTYQDPDGTVKFYIPNGTTSDPKVTVIAPQGMPITRAAEKTKTPNVYTVKYPVKPGETQFNLSYALPATAKFSSQILHTEGPTRLVIPAGVKATGDNVTFLSTEPRTQASIFDIKSPSYSIELVGTGSLKGAGDDSETQGPEIKAIEPMLYDHLYQLLAAALAMMAVAFTILYRNGQNATVNSPKGKRGA